MIALSRTLNLGPFRGFVSSAGDERLPVLQFLVEDYSALLDEAVHGVLQDRRRDEVELVRHDFLGFHELFPLQKVVFADRISDRLDRGERALQVVNLILLLLAGRRVLLLRPLLRRGSRCGFPLRLSAHARCAHGFSVAEKLSFTGINI